MKSVSLFDGYRNNPEKTAEVLRDGWYFSGDLGFRWDEEYYVIGRRKDIIIVAGKNLYPEDVEDALHAVPGIVPGRVVVFGQYGGAGRSRSARLPRPSARTRRRGNRYAAR